MNRSALLIVQNTSIASHQMENTSSDMQLNDTFFKNTSRFHAVPEHEYTIRLIFVVAMAVFSVAGFCGNFLIVLSICLIRELRSTRNAFLANLAVSDIVLVVVVVPFNIVGVLRGEPYWQDRLTLCKFVASVCAPGCLTAIWSVTGVAFNRYFFICRNESYDKYFSPFKTIFWIIAIWILAFAIHLPNHLGWGHNGYVKQFFLCTRETSLWSYSTFFSVVGIVLPLLISFFSYCRIYALVRTTTSARHQIIGLDKLMHINTISSGPCATATEGVSLSQKQSGIPTGNRVAPAAPSGCEKVKAEMRANRKFREELLLVRTLFRSFAVFVVAWLPLAVLLMLPHLDAPTWVYLTTVFLAHGSTATNSILYFLTNESFRRGFCTVTRETMCNYTGREDTAANVPGMSRRLPHGSQVDFSEVKSGRTSRIPN